jgi:hypothetical protein
MINIILHKFYYFFNLVFLNNLFTYFICYQRILHYENKFILYSNLYSHYQLNKISSRSLCYKSYLCFALPSSSKDISFIYFVS